MCCRFTHRLDWWGDFYFSPFFFGFSRLLLIGVSSSHMTLACLTLTKESTPRVDLESEVQGRDIGMPGADAGLALTGLWASTSLAVRYDHENISAEAAIHIEGVLTCETFVALLAPLTNKIFSDLRVDQDLSFPDGMLYGPDRPLSS